jgi:hypothetical protein
MMDAGLLIAALIFFFIGIGLFISAYNSYKKVKFIKAAKLYSIGSLSSGPIKIRGRVVSDNTLLSPYSKKQCVYYRYRTTSAKFRSATGSPRASGAALQEVAGGENVIPFELVDETGRVKINPEGADFIGLDKINYYVSASNETMSLKERIKKLKQMGESDFKKCKIPVHIPNDLIPYDDSLSHSRYDYLFGDTYIEPDSEIIMVGSADRLADNSFQIHKKSVMFVSRDEEMLKKSLSNNNILRFFAVGLLMILVGIVLLIVGM